MLRQLSSSATRRFSSASFARRYSTATRSAVNQSARPLLFAGVATISGFALATYALSSPILADDKKSVKAPKKEDYIIEESSESKSESDAASKKTEKTTEESTPETPKEDEQPQGAYNPETGEINWDCPCLGGMAHGPCGEDFKTAFSCFVYSEAEPKGVDCIEKFAAMQDCFRQYPEIYSEELRDDAESSSPKEDDKTDAPKADAPKADAPKADAPKADAPKDDAPKVKTVGSALSDAVSPVTATVTKAAQPVVDYVKPIADAAQPVVDAAKPAAKAIADAAGPVTAAVISSAGPIAHAIAKPITDAIESKEPLLKDNAPVDSDKPSESSQISSDHK